MEKFRNGFTKFYITVLAVLMVIVIYYCKFYWGMPNKSDIIPGIILISTIFFELFIINKNLDLTLKIISI